MNLFIATSYDGLAGGIVALGAWGVAVLFTLTAGALVSFRKSRRVGRKVAQIACIIAAPQFVVWSYWMLRDGADYGAAGIIGISLIPLAISGLLLWFTPATIYRSEHAKEA